MRQSEDYQQQLGHPSARFGGVDNIGVADFENLSQQRESTNGNGLLDPLISSPPMVIDVDEEHKNYM